MQIDRGTGRGLVNGFVTVHTKQWRKIKASLSFSWKTKLFSSCTPPPEIPHSWQRLCLFFDKFQWNSVQGSGRINVEIESGRSSLEIIGYFWRLEVSWPSITQTYSTSIFLVSEAYLKMIWVLMNFYFELFKRILWKLHWNYEKMY